MENIRKLLDRCKQSAEVETDYALAKKLGLKQARISAYYSGKEAPNEFACLKIAEALDMPLANVIATVKAEAEKDEKRRGEWRDYLKKLGGVAASLLTAICANVILEMTPIAGKAHATTVCAAGQFVLCKLRRIARTASEAVRRAQYMRFRRVCCAS